MKLVTTKCPQCGGAMQIDEQFKKAVCPFCETVFVVDDEKQHIQFDGAEQAGYEFEKGRIKARQEAKKEEAMKHIVTFTPPANYHPYNSNRAYNASTEYKPQEYKEQPVRYYEPAPKKKTGIFWWVLGWIFFFPIPLTVLIGRSKMPLILKILLLTVLWGLVVLVAIANL